MRCDGFRVASLQFVYAYKKTLYPFFQSTLTFRSTTNQRHIFFLILSFLNHFSPEVDKPVAHVIDSSMTSNSSEPTLAQCPSNVFANSRATAISNPSIFCKNERNPNSCNSERLFWYSAIFFISFTDDGSCLTGTILFESTSILCHSPRKISHFWVQRGCREFYDRDPSVHCLIDPFHPIMFNH